MSHDVGILLHLTSVPDASPCNDAWTLPTSVLWQHLPNWMCTSHGGTPTGVPQGT